MSRQVTLFVFLSILLLSDIHAQRRTSQRRSDREKAAGQTQAEQDPLLEEYGFGSREELAQALLGDDPSTSDRKIIERYRAGERLSRRQKSRLSLLLEAQRKGELVAGGEEAEEAANRRAARRERSIREKSARERPERAARERVERSAREKRESARTRERSARTRPSRSARGEAKESVEILESGLDFRFDGTITGPPDEATKESSSGRRRSRSARTADETAQEVSEITAQIMTKDRSFVYVDGGGQLAVSRAMSGFRWQLRPAGPQRVLAFDPVSEKSLAWTESGSVGLAEMTEDSIEAEIETMVKEGWDEGFPEGVKWSFTLLTGNNLFSPGLTPAAAEETGIALLIKDDQGLMGDGPATSGKEVELPALDIASPEPEKNRRSGRKAHRGSERRSARSLLYEVELPPNWSGHEVIERFWDENDNGVADRVYRTFWGWVRRDGITQMAPLTFGRNIREPEIQFGAGVSPFLEGFRWPNGSSRARVVVRMNHLNGLADYQADYFVTHSLSPGDTVASGTVTGLKRNQSNATEWIEFAVTDDMELREDETYTVTLLQKEGGNAILGDQTTHTVHITDNDFDPTFDLLGNLDRFQLNIDALVARVDGMREYTEPASDGLSGVGDVVDQLVEIKEGSEEVKGILSGARRLPYVGPLFKPAYSSVRPVPSLARTLANSACRVDRTLDPVEQVVDKTDAMMEVIADGLIEIGHASRRTYGLLEFAKQCAAGSTFPVSAKLGREGCSPGSPCTVGQGDCDIDSECGRDLLCKQRTYGEWVPGVFLTANISDAYDICYDPGEAASGTTVAVNYGGEGCSAGSPCPEGGGDCDNHNECAGDLRCKQRSSGESVPGLTFFDNFPDHYDVCYNPDASSEGGAVARLPGSRASNDFTISVEEAQIDYLRGVGSAADALESANRSLNDIENQMEEITEAMESALSVLDDYEDVMGYISPLESVVPNEIRDVINEVSRPRRIVESIPVIGWAVRQVTRYVSVAEDVVIDLVMDQFDFVFDNLDLPDLDDMLPEFDPDLNIDRVVWELELEMDNLHENLSTVLGRIEEVLALQTALQLSILSDFHCLEGGGEALRGELIAAALATEAHELQEKISDYRASLNDESRRSRNEYSSRNSCR